MAEDLTFAFVPYSEILRWCAHGWQISADLGYYHGQYSVLMEHA